jgi:hypothetical protein
MKKIKFLLFIWLFLVHFFSIGQDRFSLIREPKTIPSYGVNGKFVKYLNSEFEKLAKSKVDSIFLYYPVENNSNFAMIYWNKKNVRKVAAYFQYNPPNEAISKELLNNDTLTSVNIESLYEILLDDLMRTIDTTKYVSVYTPVYCQFYLAGKKDIKSAYEGSVMSEFPHDFLNAYISESTRILGREVIRHKTPRMKF